MPGWEFPVSSTRSTQRGSYSPQIHISVDLQDIHGQMEVHELRQKNFCKSFFFFFYYYFLYSSY